MEKTTEALVVDIIIVPHNMQPWLTGARRQWHTGAWRRNGHATGA
jgi:hypothetical protein